MPDKKNTSCDEAKEEHYVNALCAVERINALMDGVNTLAGGNRYSENPSNKERDAFVEAATWCVDYLTTLARDEFRPHTGKETAPYATACEA